MSLLLGHGIQQRLPAHRRPPRLNLDRSRLPRPPMPETRPSPLDGLLGQSPRHRVAVDIAPLLQTFLPREDVEVIVARLPERPLPALNGHR